MKQTAQTLAALHTHTHTHTHTHYVYKKNKNLKILGLICAVKNPNKIYKNLKIDIQLLREKTA